MQQSLIFLLLIVPLYASSLGYKKKDKSDNSTPTMNSTPTKNNTSVADSTPPNCTPSCPNDKQWRENRFHPACKTDYSSKCCPQQDLSAMKIGLTIAYEQFKPSNTSVAQASNLSETQASTSPIPEGSSIDTDSKYSPGFTIQLAFKFDPDPYAWILAAEYKWILATKSGHQVDTKNNQTTNASYQTKFDHYMKDLQHIDICTDSKKLQLLGLLIDRPLVTKDHCYISAGMTGRCLIINQAWDVNYTNTQEQACLSSNHKSISYGPGLNFKMALFFTSNSGLEFNVESDLLFASSKINKKSCSEVNGQTMHYINTKNRVDTFNQLTAFNGYLVFNDYEFSTRHLEFKIGFEYMSTDQNYITREFNDPLTDSNTLHVFGPMANLSIYF